MTGLIKFEFEGHDIEAVADNNAEPLFNARLLCDALEFSNPHDALARHVSDDDLVKHEVIDSLGRKQLANFVREAGMWALVMRANTEPAKRFQRFVTSVMLPAVRKTGTYSAPNAVTSSAAELRSKAMLKNAEVRMHRELMRSIDEINAVTPLAAFLHSTLKFSAPPKM